MAEKVEQPTEEKGPAKPAKAVAKKPAKKEKQPKQKDGMYLPVLVEFTFASSVIFLILVFLAMAAISWFTGTSLLDFVLRTSAAMGVLGGLLMVVTQQVSAGVLSANLAELEDIMDEKTSQKPGQLEFPDRLEQPESINVSENVGIHTFAEVQ